MSLNGGVFHRHTWARKRFEESIVIIGEPVLPGPS